MEEQNHANSLPFSAINWVPNTNNAYGFIADGSAYQHYMTNGIHHQPVPIPQWMHCEQTPHNYVEFLGEMAYPEFQKQMSYDISPEVPSFGLPDPYQLDVGNLITACSGLEPQLRVQKEIWNGDCKHGYQAYPGSGSAAPKYNSDARRKRTREKAYAAERVCISPSISRTNSRRLRISHWLDALRELVPHGKEVGKADLLDVVIDHVKYLQHEMKELCRSRLEGESTSDSVIFLEGHGHYIVQDQTLNGPIEQMMGKLIDVNPSAATELLQSRGLVVMPMTFAEGLLEPIEMFDMQEKGEFLIPNHNE